MTGKKKNAFNIGETVVYPKHGVGEILKIESMEIANIKTRFYVVKMEQSKLTIRVPLDKQKEVGLRKISSKVPLVIHPGDDELYGTYQTIYFVQSADAVITPDYGGRFMYEQMSIPTVYLRQPVLDFVDPPPGIKKTIDVSYIGDCTKADRSDFIRTCGCGSQCTNIN